MSEDNLPDLLRQMVCHDSGDLETLWNAADEIERLRARLAEVERASGVACSGCGCTETIEQIRARNPNAISCCPERDMVPAVAWMKRAEQAERGRDGFIRQIDEVYATVSDHWFLDPPDGGDVRIHEGVKRIEDAWRAAVIVADANKGAE